LAKPDKWKTWGMVLKTHSWRGIAVIRVGKTRSYVYFNFIHNKCNSEEYRRLKQRSEWSLAGREENKRLPELEIELVFRRLRAQQEKPLHHYVLLKAWMVWWTLLSRVRGCFMHHAESMRETASLSAVTLSSTVCTHQADRWISLND
jgi:hypothetical protein